MEITSNSRKLNKIKLIFFFYHELFFQIVHLKRFNFVNNKWVKSQKVVNFPFKDFDPTPYLASVPQETILRHKEISDNLHDNIEKSERHPKMCNIDCDDDEVIEFNRSNYNETNNQINNNLLEDSGKLSSSSLSSLPSSSSEIKNKINEKDIIENNFRTYLIENDENDDVDGVLQDDGENRNSINDLPVSNPSKETTLERRKRLISTSLTKTPVIDGEFTDFHNHILNEGEDPFNLKYQLYAVVVSTFFSICLCFKYRNVDFRRVEQGM